MGRTSFCLLLGLLTCAPAAVWAAPEQSPEPCPVADEFLAPPEPLSDFAAALKKGGTIHVFAVGSATTVGEESSSAPGAAPGSSFPYRMVDTLRALRPGVNFELTVRGGRGLTAAAMLEMVQLGLKEQHIDLLLWQVGTVETVRGMRPDSIQTALQDGIEQARDDGANVVLIDPQFSRFLRTNADLDPYEAVLTQLSAMPGVALFRRYDLMRSWVDDGVLDLERTPKAERGQAIARLNTCLGDALAHFVLNGAEK